jgi:hypothetical protein
LGVGAEIKKYKCDICHRKKDSSRVIQWKRQDARFCGYLDGSENYISSASENWDFNGFHGMTLRWF